MMGEKERRNGTRKEGEKETFKNGCLGKGEKGEKGEREKVKVR